MINIEKSCHKITRYICNELNLDDEKREVINYGLFAFLQMIYSFILVFCIGYIFKVQKEALITVVVISHLRKASGGVHASTPISCLLMGTVLSVLSAIILKLVNYNIKSSILMTIIVFIYAYYIVYKKAPVDSVNKLIKSPEKRKRLKKASIKILTCYLVIIILFAIYYNGTNLNYIMSINFGVFWQIFSLTKYGKVFFYMVDYLILREEI